MKKLLPILLTLALVVGAFAACGGNKEESGAGEETKTTGAVKTGVGVVSSVEKSTPPKGSDKGVAEASSLVAAVVIDADGKIAQCKVDSAQSKIEFDAKGKLVTKVDTIFESKQDLGAKYGMKKASKIKKEWNEQADAFAEYCKGKTLDEVKGIAVDGEGYAEDADLKSSVTVHVGDFIAAVEKAANNAAELGAGTDDTLGLAVETNIAKSVDATDKEEGVAQAYTNYVAVTTDGSGKITSSIVEGSQSDVNFDTSGKITTDLKAELKSKRELGDEYGMKKASSIKKEWYEQADAFADYIKGKTVEEVKGIKVNKEGNAEDADLKSSVTIGVADYIQLVEKAAGKAS